LGLAQPLVMGIVNVTPDSFSDGGLYVDHEAAVARALDLVAAGADIIDIGGESTRPGAAPVGIDTELQRVVPVLRALVPTLEAKNVAVSLDTRNAEVMAAGISLGVHIINDVNGLRGPGSVPAVAASKAGVCVMHMRGNPTTMQNQPRYRNVIEEVHSFLADRMNACEAAGIEPGRVTVDPGFGFGKSPEQNMALLRSLRSFDDLGIGLLVGLSRKSLLGHLTGRPIRDRLAASVAAAIMAAEQGANILRVHDVGETVDALRVWSAVRASEPVTN
jgi:dihydropteroate synthase